MDFRKCVDRCGEYLDRVESKGYYKACVKYLYGVAGWLALLMIIGSLFGIIESGRVLVFGFSLVVAGIMCFAGKIRCPEIGVYSKSDVFKASITAYVPIAMICFPLTLVPFIDKVAIIIGQAVSGCVICTGIVMVVADIAWPKRKAIYAAARNRITK